MDQPFTGRAALVLASSGGLGLGIAGELARQGADVMLFARSGDRLVAAQRQVQSDTGREPAYFVGDVAKAGDVEAAVAATRDRFGGLFALVNNCGGPRAAPFEQLTDDDWHIAFELTLYSYVRAIRAAVPIMREAGGGRILNVSSSSTKRAIPNLVLSNVFRLGVLGLTKTLAIELGPAQILVNTVGAGGVLTDRIRHLDAMNAQRTGKTVEQVQADVQQRIPLGRYGRPEEFGRLCAFLCSPANTYVTGQNILVDGGDVAAY